MENYQARWRCLALLCIPLLLVGLWLPPALAAEVKLPAAQPLQEFLDANGTLRAPPGFRGSIDARGLGGQGWQLVSGRNEAPRFAAIGSSPDRSLGASPTARSPLAADDHWDGRFSDIQGVNGTVMALAMDGSGILYAGGDFTTAGGGEANHVARWDGSIWSPLGSGMDGDVYALAVDGGGNLYAGGTFAMAGGIPANSIARWDGTTWSALDSGMNSIVWALVVDGSGNLYAGGDFTMAGGVEASYVARWDGTAWSALGSGTNNEVWALAVDDSGTLYAGGEFATAGGLSANYIARWDGSSWSALGSGTNNYVWALVVDGSGNLYAGGDFTTAGDVEVYYVARWNGTAWSALGSGMNSTVSALAVDGSGVLYAGGFFAQAGGVEANRIARWDGSTWSPLGSGMTDRVMALAVDGSGDLYAGGDFTAAGGIEANRIARWDGTAWSALHGGMNGNVLSLEVDSDENVDVGGAFTYAGDIPAAYIAHWGGLGWSPVGGGMGSYVWALEAVDSGSLYAGGTFHTAGGVPVNHVARWDGTAWSALGSGTNVGIFALAMDSGGILYAGGEFTTAGGIRANYIARWNGSSWSALGSGMNGDVRALAASVSGNFYAGGEFTTAGGTPANQVARWDGTAWSPLGSGTNGMVRALAVDGSGNVYAGGSFTQAGGIPVNYVARWGGAQWAALGSGMNGTVCALVVDGSGNLYAAGNFTTAGGVPANRIARWDGSSWSPLGSGLNNWVNALALDSSGSLYAGGQFTTAGNKPSLYIARWFNTAPLARPDSYSMLEDTVLSVPAPGVLGNDSDDQDDPLTLSPGTPPPEGALALYPDGSFHYTPTLNYFGPVTFTYRLADDYGGVSTGTVSITVTNVNDEPLPADDFYTTGEDAVLVVSPPGVLGNDFDIDGDRLTATLGAPPLSGTLALQADGSLVYTPTLNEAGLDSFIYQVSDGELSDSAFVEIEIIPVNDAPVAMADAYSTPADTPLTVAAPGVLANDGDVEGDPLTAVLDTPPASGTLALGADGSLTYTPPAGFSGIVTATYHADDGQAGSAPARLVLFVGMGNTPPLVEDDAYTTNEDTPLLVAAPGVLGNDLDPEGAPLTAAVQVPPAHGTLALSAEGALTYTPELNWNGVVSFTYVASDGELTATAVVRLTVEAVNDAPVAVVDAYTAISGTTLIVAAPGVLRNDGDADGDPLTAVLDTPPASGTLALSADGSLIYIPPAGFSGAVTFTYHADDGQAGSAPVVVTITVLAEPVDAWQVFLPVVFRNSGR